MMPSAIQDYLKHELNTPKIGGRHMNTEEKQDFISDFINVKIIY